MVAVFLSGRPLWVNAEMNASNAFIAAFLPGSEGGGVADVLFRKADGSINHDFRGKLSFSWPKRPDQFVLNRRDPGYDPLFAFGYGLSYAAPSRVGKLDETRPVGMDVGASGPIFAKGRVPDGWSVTLAEAGQSKVRVLGSVATTASKGLGVSGVDRRAQEDARRFAWTGAGTVEARIEASRPIDLSRESNGELSLTVEYRIDAKPTGPVSLAMISGDTTKAVVPVTGIFSAASVGQWQTVAVPLRCFAGKGANMTQITAPFVVETAGALTLSISDVRIDSVGSAIKCGT